MDCTSEYLGPPQGGLRKTMSAESVGPISKKSPTMNCILSATPYTAALCLAISTFTGSMSMAITGNVKKYRF